MCDIVSHNWSVDFDIVRPLQDLPAILNICQSTINDSRYQWSSREHGQYVSRNTTIFQYTLSGCGAFDDGEKTHILPAGTAFLTNAEDKNYKYFYRENSQDEQVVLWCNLRSSSTSGISEEIISRFGNIFQLPQTSGIIQTLMEFRNTGNSHLTMLASENAKLATDLLYALIWSREKKNDSNSEGIIIERALQIINRDEGILYNAGELADKLAISREHLSRVFRKQLNKSPYRYIVSIKIELAKMKLRNTFLSSKQISQELGFTSPVQFTNIFKKYTGITPGNYRKSYRRSE